MSSLIALTIVTSVMARNASGRLRSTLGRLLLFSILSGIVLVALSKGEIRNSAASPLPLHTHLRPEGDLAVLANPSGTYTIFVADGKSGKISYREIKPQRDVEAWDSQGFTTLEIVGSNVPKSPTGLAVHGSSLYVLDSSEGAVFVIKLETPHTARLLLRKPLIDNPLSIAVSDEGILAIGQDDKSVLLYDPAKPDASPTALAGNIDEPLRLQFLSSTSQQGPGLLVLDGDKMDHLTLYEPSAQEPKSYAAREIPVPSDVLARLEQQRDILLDMAFTDGNYYLTEGHNWAVFSQVGMTSPRWVLFPQMYQVTPDRLRSTGNNLFVLDAEKHQVFCLSLKLMTLRMEVNAPDANALLTDLYQSLYDKGSLPERQYKVRDRGALIELLKQEHVLAPGNYSTVFPKTETVKAQGAMTLRDLEFVLCLLNKSLNGWRCPNSSSEATVDRLTRTFGQGQVVKIPGLGVEQIRYEGQVTLTDHTVEDAVKSRLMLPSGDAPTPSMLNDITTEYLMRITPAYYRTLEYEMTRRGYILTSPPLLPQQLAPGTLLRIVQNREQTDVPSGCQQSLPEITAQLHLRPMPTLSEKLRLYAPGLEYLPRKESGLSNQAILSEWNKLGVMSVEIIFDDPVEEFGSHSAFLNIAVPQCWTPLKGPGIYLVSDVVKVSGMKYRLLRQGGKVLTLKQDELDRWGLVGLADDSGDWSVSVQTPYVLGYRGVPWDGRPFASLQSPSKRGSNLTLSELRFALDPHSVKPGSEQDIWTKSSGRFVLPGFRWEVKLLTDSSILEGESVVRKWAARYPEKVYVWPALDKAPDGNNTHPTNIVNSPAESLHDTSQASRQQEDLSQVTTNRDLLRKAISFPSNVKSGDITIGLMERTASIEQLNPDFAWRKIEEDCAPDGTCPWEFVWLEPSADTSTPLERLRHTVSFPSTRMVRTREQIMPEEEAYWGRNHGTHIAGLLVSNNKDALGLLPDATICWLELGNPPVSLPEQITQKNSNSLRVINISQEFMDSSYDWLMNQLGTEGSALVSKLFVIAAGNNGIDLNKDSNVKPPVAWLHQFNNLLSVSAVDMSQKLLFKSDGAYRVNYGVKYVDLLAPGDDIYSSTESDAYAATSGTSQAAPMVTAAAALLAKTVGGAIEPSLLKGRLIYTADWEGKTLEERNNWDEQHSYMERVWGGCLNADRAITGYDHDIFLYEFGTGTRKRAIHDIPSHIKLNIKNWNTDAYFLQQPHRPGDTIKAALTEGDKQIEFDQVLRLLRLKNNLYRIVYKDKPGRLRIIMNASIDQGAIKYRIYDEVVGDSFEDRPILSAMDSIRLDKIIDYVGNFGKMGSKISF